MLLSQRQGGNFHGYERKSVLQYVLVKQLQVLYGNCLFKYPDEKGRHCYCASINEWQAKSKHSANKATVTEGGYTGGTPSRISLSRNNSRRCRARLNRNITFVYTQNWMSSQTHSLSMEKQVTGPSAAQVAVLKTSLQEEKHCTWQPGKTYCTYALVNNSVWKKGKFSCQKVEKTLHQHLKSTTFYMFCVVATGLSPSEWMNYSRSWHLQHINICKKKRKLFAKEVRKCCIFINSLISMLHKSASEKPPNKTAKLLQRTLTGWYLIFNEKPPLHNQYVCQLQVCCHIF